MPDGELTPFLRQYGDPPATPVARERRASVGFVTQLVDALVGQPGDPELARVAGKWRSDSAALPWIALGYVSGVPQGFRGAVQSTLAIIVAGQVAAIGTVQAALETPARPGTISPDNVFVQYIGQKRLIALAAQLRPLVEQIDRDGDILTGSERVANAVAGAIIVATREERSKLIAAETPYAFGQELGAIAGRFGGEIAINEGLHLAERSAGAAKLVKDLPELADEYQSVIKQNPETKKAMEELGAQINQSQSQMEDATAATGKKLSESPAPSASATPEKTPQSRFQLGDVGAAEEGAPVNPIVRTTVEAPPSASLVTLVAEVRALPKTPTWVAQVADEDIALIAGKADQLVARVDKLAGKDLVTRRSMLAGFVQEETIPLHPRFSALKARLKAELAQDPYWDAESIQFATVRNIEPATNLDQRTSAGTFVVSPSAQEQELADGVLIVRAKDPNARAQVLIGTDFESKSPRNVADLFFERESGARLAQQGQIARDVERFSNTDLVFDILEPDGKITTLSVPAGRTAISRRTSSFVLVTPRPVPPEYRAILTNELGIKSSRIEEWPPTFPRAEIDDWAELLLQWALRRKKK